MKTVTWDVYGTPDLPVAKNVIFMIADGLSVADRTTARLMSKGMTEGKANGRLNLDDLQYAAFIGTSATSNANGTFMDCGFMMGNLMNALTSLGFGSCPQFSAVCYPEVLRKHIPGSEDTLFIAALPFGRPKAGSHVNQFQPERLPVDEWFKVVS